MVTMGRTFILLAVALLMLLGLSTADLQGSKPERSLFLDMSEGDLSGTPSTDGDAFHYTGNNGVQRLEARRLLRPTPSAKRPPPKSPRSLKAPPSPDQLVKEISGG